jgi:23S rRNA (guanosine2251-2'-O)-methyltransferase
MEPSDRGYRDRPPPGRRYPAPPDRAGGPPRSERPPWQGGPGEPGSTFGRAGGSVGPPPWQRQPAGPASWPRPVPSLPPPDLLGPDEELVAGRRPVEEAFAAGRTAHRLVVVPQRRGALEQLVLHATRLRIPIVEVEGGSLTALAGFDGHQGIALVVDPRRFASPEEILARAAERGEPPFVLVLDSLEDPQNVGTLLRSAEAAGVHGVIFPTRRQAPLTPAAVKASAGAVEHLLLCPVDDLPGTLADLHAQGLRIAGSEADAPMTARQTDLRGPLAIVVGSEGQGLGPAVRRRCDLFMRIPMRGTVGSLNAAVAGSVLLFEAVAQRDPDARSRPREIVPARTSAVTPGSQAIDIEPDTIDAAPPEVEGNAGAQADAEDASVEDESPATPPESETEPTAPTPGSDDDLLPGGPIAESARTAGEPKPSPKPRKPRATRAQRSGDGESGDK